MIGHSSVHQSELTRPFSSMAPPIQFAMAGPRTRTPNESAERDEEAHEHAEGRELLGDEPPGLLGPVDLVQAAHERVHGARRRPEREQEADDDEGDSAVLVLRHPGEAVLQERA